MSRQKVEKPYACVVSHTEILLACHAILPNEHGEGMSDKALKTSAREAIVYEHVLHFEWWVK